MEVCVVLLPIVIHLLMRAMTFAGLYIILRIKTTPDEFLVYCNLTSNDGKKRMMAAGVNADFIDKTNKKLTDVIERHPFFSIADRRVFPVYLKIKFWIRQTRPADVAGLFFV
ncbi:MAG: hypothetical protein ACLTS6_16170 [Anaerobutyricum sp.]